MENLLKAISAKIRDRLIILEPHNTHLEHCWTCCSGTAVFMRSAPILSKAAAETYYTVARQLDQTYKKGSNRQSMPLRLIACQLCHPDSEWDTIEMEQLWLTWLTHQHGLSAQMKHLVLPSQSLYTSKKGEVESEFFLRAVDRLALNHNIDGWESYCFWITEEIEQLLAKAKYDDLAFYTLEALLKDFVIEERANILRYAEWDVAGIILKLGSARHDIDYPLAKGDEIFSLEKRLMKARSETKQRLIVQYRTLKEMVRIIEIIESAHPDLLSLKRKALLGTALMGSSLGIENVSAPSWGQQLMIMQLLHEELGVITALNSSTGAEQATIAFAVQLAISLLKDAHGADAAIDLALNWDSSVKQMNAIYAAKGGPEYKNWLHSSTKSAEELLLKKRAVLADELRHTIVAVLDQLAVSEHPHRQEEERQETLSYLALLPTFAEIHDAAQHLVHVHLINLDPATGEPVGLTKAGHYLMKGQL